MIDAVAVIARLHPDPAQRHDVIRAVQAAVPGILAEDGCQEYAPHLADDGSIVIVERWASRAALAAHDVGAAVEVLRSGVRGRTAAATEVTVGVPL